MNYIKRIISWIVSWFRKTPTPEVVPEVRRDLPPPPVAPTPERPAVTVTPGMIAEAKLVKVMNSVGVPLLGDCEERTELNMIDYIRKVASHPDYIKKPVHRGRKGSGYRI